MRISIKATHYNALQATMATKDYRYYLCGFCVDFESNKCIATDGHRLITVPFEHVDETDPDITDPAVKAPLEDGQSRKFSPSVSKTLETASIFRDLALSNLYLGQPNPSLIYGFDDQKPRKLKKTGSPDTVEIDTDRDLGEVKSGTRTLDKIAFTRIDGKYPDWRLVLPNGDGLVAVESIAFNPKLIAPAFDALEADACKYSFRGADTAIMVKFSGLDNESVEYLVMPLRS